MIKNIKQYLKRLSENMRSTRKAQGGKTRESADRMTDLQICRYRYSDTGKRSRHGHGQQDTKGSDEGQEWKHSINTQVLGS